jgi:hypothetical protein
MKLSRERREGSLSLGSQFPIICKKKRYGVQEAKGIPGLPCNRLKYV